MWWWWLACAAPAPGDDCPDLEVAGRWRGEVSVGEPAPLALDLDAAGDEVTGAVTVGDGAPLDVTGRVEGCTVAWAGRVTTRCGVTNGGGPKYCHDDWTFEGEVEGSSLRGEVAVHATNSDPEDDSSWTDTGTWWAERAE